MNVQIEPDTDVVAVLHYTRFENADVFAALVRRHGLKYVGVIEDDPSTPFWWARGLGTDEQLNIKTGCHPITGEHHGGGYRDGEEGGYASYIYLAGEVWAAEPLFRDIIETAEYIKGEFRPLSTTEADEADRTTALSGRNIGVPKVPETSNDASSESTGRESAPKPDPHPDNSWPRYSGAPVCDECGSREAMQPTSVADGSATEWACFTCSRPNEASAEQDGQQ